MKTLLGSGFEAFASAFEEPPVRGFRVNSGKISVEDFERIDNISIGVIPFIENGFYLSDEKVGAHPFHHAGMIYVQEPSAMLPVECVEIVSDWKVLDVCAAPGGKTGQIANRLGENGVLVSNEIVPQRCRVLTGNVERLGLKNVVTTCADSARLAESFPEVFDLVNVDAPCSGEGMFRKDVKAVAEWNAESPERCAKRQAEILENAALCLKSGGTMIYSTCTFSLEENEMTVDAFLSAHPEFKLVPVSEKVREATAPGIHFDGCRTENIAECRRFYPHLGRGEGQFMAMMKKAGESFRPRKIVSCLEKCKEKAVFDFLDGNLTGYDPDRVLLLKDTPVIFTPDFPVPKGLAFSCGVTIGELRGKNLKPHHQLFSAMGGRFKRKIDFSADDPLLKRYLKGETIEVSCENGFAAVLCCGCPVGGGKAVDGVLKNHYPRGLRLVTG